MRARRTATIADTHSYTMHGEMFAYSAAAADCKVATDSCASYYTRAPSTFAAPYPATAAVEPLGPK